MPETTSREILSGLIETLISYSFDWGGDIASNRIEIGDWGQFFDILLTSITSFAERGRYLPLDCFLEICIGIGSSQDAQFRDSAFRDVIGLLDYFSPNSKAIAQMFDWLRTSAKLWSPDDRSVGILNPELHRALLDRMLSKLKDDNPDHILFNGQHDCFVEVSSIPWTFTTGFTLSYWIKIPAVITNKSFELIRCKSPLLSIEVLMLAKSEAGVYSVRVVSSSEKRGRDEMRGDVLITSGEWHFLTIKYLGGTNAAANTISFSVDGSVSLESKLTYPVVSQSLETLWTFGNSFQGLIGSITLYSGEVNQSYLHFLHSLGPYVSDIGKGASTPQSSYDSGHTPLGTLFTKGPWTKVHKLPRVFCLNPLTVKSNFTLSLSKAGRQFQEFVSMSTSQKQEMEQSLMVGLHGKCTTVQGLSWVDQLFTCGGVTLPLYLFWTYCTRLGRVGLTDDVHLKACLQKLLGVLQHLVAVHVDMKEQFIQLHGYHILSHCLYRCLIDAKEAAELVDASLIGGVVDIAVSFRLDSTKGDGVAAALQGLLFDFRLWSMTALPHLKIVLEAAGNVALGAADQMYAAIGIQRLLDLVRIHLLKPLTITSRMSEEQKTIAIDCADELLRMLIIMKDSAHAQAQKQKTNISADIDCLLGCLEETNNNLLAERILRLLIQTRHTSPGSLKRSMMNYRFLDTTILAIWMKKGMSLEVRSHAFKLLLWMLSVELHALPSKLYEMRRNVRFVSFVQSSSQSRKLKPVQADANRIRLGLSQLKEESKGLSKIWRNLWMLAEVVERGLADEIWGASYAVVLPPSTVGGGTVHESPVVASPDLQFLITDISMEFQRTAWLYLPFLVPMLSRATVEVAVKTMMLVNVQFKTDEHVLEAIMATEQELWVTMFLKLTWMGTKRFYTTTGDIAMEFETLADISAETFSIVVEYLMRMGIDDDAAFWPSVVDLAMDFTKTVTTAGTSGSVGSNGGSPVVPGTTAPTPSFGFLFLRRVVYLVLQRIVKTSEDAWSPSLVQSVNVLLDVITKHNLHKVPANVTSVTSSSSVHQDPGSLLDLDEQRHLELTHVQWSSRESEQLLYFLLDLLNALLRVSKKLSLQGMEWLAMIRVYHLMLDCTTDVSDAVLERLLSEMYQFLGKASETAAPFTEQDFYALVVKTFTTLKENIFRLDYLHPKRAKCEASVFRLLGHFTDLRLRVQEGYEVPLHVRKTMEALRIVGQMADIKMIFDVLEQTFKVNQPSVISFDDFVAPEDLPLSTSSAAVGAAASGEDGFGTPAHDPTTSTTLLDLTEAGDGMIPPPDAGFAAFATAALEPARSSPSDTMGGSSPSVTSPPSGAGTVDAGAAAPVTVAARYARAFPQWLALRQNIISERIDTERARLTRAMTLQDIATESTKKYWRRLRRKVEAEIFQEAHYCQWKLGIAHEGPFFGRKRLICRPKYDNFYNGLVPSPMHQHQRLDASFVHDVDLSSDELNEALQRQYTGYIKDVTRSEAGDSATGTGGGGGGIGAGGDGTGEESRHGDGGSGLALASTASVGGDASKRDDVDSGGYVDLPGSGWGVVGADGSDEGFGVVGVAQDFSPVGDAGASSSDLTGGDTPVVPTSKASVSSGATSAAASGTPGGSGGTTDEDGRPLRPTTNVVGDADELYRTNRTAIETGPCQAAMFKSEHAFKLEAKVVMITASGTCWGVFAIHGEELTFRSSSEQSEARKQDHASVNAAKDTKLRRRRWKIEHIAYIYLRRYRLRDSALEIFFRKGKHRSVFVDFGHTREDAKLRNEFAKAVSQAAPASAFKQTPSMSAFRMVYEHDNIQEKWLQGKISNFDYLMALNTIAGRSFNDLCQYPVMPWVLNDYTSATINLQDPTVYRDLSKPMGALNPTRLKEFLDRFHSFEENVSSGIPAFMYGSHYSTMVGVVLHFLVRLQPFAALHQEMQNGHFDVPDRLFSSIPRSFAHNTNQLSEVKELIPEFFTNPDIFRNVNNFNFGETQDGDNIDNVELPPWAKTPEDFVRIHRDALESDYVSEHLHEWIDLIFGYKQRGPDAIEACNVFYYLTYYGSVDHYLITDEAVRKATELQIAHFGQIPMQLFKTPHPARRMHKIRSAPTYVRPLKDCFSSQSVTRLIEPRSDEESIATEAPATLLVRNANSVVVALLVHLDRVTLVLDTGVLDTVKYAASEEVKAMLQAAKEAAKDEAALMVSSTTSTAAMAAAPALANGGGSGASGRGARRGTMGEAATATAVAAPATVNFPEDFLFPPSSSSGRSTSGDGSTSSGGVSAAAATTATSASTSVTAASRRGRGYSATEDLLGLDSGGQSLDSSTSSATSASLTTVGHNAAIATWTRPFVTLRDGESIFTIEREVHHFETLPRLPISKKLVQLRWQQRSTAASTTTSLALSSSVASSTTSTGYRPIASGGAGGPQVSDRYEQYYKVKPPVQASESIAEAMASLVIFSRNRLLTLTIGDVDGTVHVRELDHKLGAVKSAADFCVHRSRVISASMDQNGREYHLVATLDEQGTVLVWTIYAPKSGAQSSGANGGANGGAAAGAGGTAGAGGGKASGVSSASTSGKDSGGGGGAMSGAAGASVGGGVGGGAGAGGNGVDGAGAGTGGSGGAGGGGATTEQEYLARLHSYTIGRRPQRRFYVAPTTDMRVDVSWAMGLVTVVTGTRVHLFSIERDELLRVFEVPVTMDNGLDVLTSTAVGAPLPPPPPAQPSSSSLSQPTAATSESGDLLLDVTDAVLTSDDDDDTNIVTVEADGAVHGALHAIHHRECATSGPVACVFTRDRFTRPTGPSAATVAVGAAVSPPPASRHFLRRMIVSDYGVIVTHIESVTTVESLLEYEDAVVHVHRLVAQTMSGTVTGVIQALSPITCLVCPDRAEVVIAGHRDGSVVVYRVQNLQVLYRWQPDAHCVAVPLVSSSLTNAMASSIGLAGGNATSASMRSGRTGGGLLPSSSSSTSSQPTPIAVSQPPLSPAQAVDTSAIVTIAVGPSAAAPAVLLLSTEAGNLYIRALPDFVRWEKNRNPTVLQMASEQLQAVKGTILQAQNWGAETAGVLAQNAMAELKKMRNNSIVKGVFGFFGAQLGGNDATANDAAPNNSTSGSGNSKSAKKK